MIVAIVFVGLAVRLWPIMRNFNAEEAAVERFIADAPFDAAAVPEAWLTVTPDRGGRTLVISFIGRPERTSDGRCVTTYIARAEESESQVRVSIIAVTSPAEGFTSVRECGSDVETRTAVATLDAPLGSRDVINEATGFVEPIATETEDSRPSAVDPTSTAGGAAAATDELCASLVPGQYGFFQSLPTTVGEIRTVEGGPAPGSRLWPDALAGHADGDAAAWCQGKDAGNGYVFYVATFDGTMELLGRAHLLGTPKPGPLIVE